MTLFLSQNVGGPALIFDRFQEAGSTTVGHKRGAPLTKKILGLGKVFLINFCIFEVSQCMSKCPSACFTQFQIPLCYK